MELMTIKRQVRYFYLLTGAGDLTVTAVAVLLRFAGVQTAFVSASPENGYRDSVPNLNNTKGNDYVSGVGEGGRPAKVTSLRVSVTEGEELGVGTGEATGKKNETREGTRVVDFGTRVTRAQAAAEAGPQVLLVGGGAVLVVGGGQWLAGWNLEAGLSRRRVST
ncbi:hypothetical protein R6Q57_028746 [Mikania cordata]